jgi:signal transduction histidine kinase
MERIFDKFISSNGSITGTGLGMVISKEFIGAQAGTRWVENTVNKGSTFKFHLPIGKKMEIDA